MPELIYKQEALDKLKYMYLLIERDRGQGCEVAKGLRKACRAISDIKAVDTEFVRHGHWENIAGMNNTVFCSECLAAANKELAMKYKGCPFCLARMDATDTNVGGKRGDDSG